MCEAPLCCATRLVFLQHWVAESSATRTWPSRAHMASVESPLLGRNLACKTASGGAAPRAGGTGGRGGTGEDGNRRGKSSPPSPGGSACRAPARRGREITRISFGESWEHGGDVGRCWWAQRPSRLRLRGAPGPLWWWQGRGTAPRGPASSGCSQSGAGESQQDGTPIPCHPGASQPCGMPTRGRTPWDSRF